MVIQRIKMLDAEGIIDPESGFGFVQGIEMDAFDVMVEQIQNLFSCPVNANFLHVFVILRPGHGSKEFGRKACPERKFGHADHALSGCNGHDTGDNGDGDAGNFTPLAKIVEVPIVEKKLRADIIRSRIYLAF